MINSHSSFTTKHLCVIAITGLALSLTIPPAHSKPKGTNGSNAIISYQIDENCGVTVSSTKNIKSIVLKNDQGNTIQTWRNIKGKTFSDFGNFVASMPDGTLHIESGKNGDGSESDIGQDFRDDLLACLTPDCPFEDTIVNLNGLEITADGPLACLGVTAAGEFVFIYDSTGGAIDSELSFLTGTRGIYSGQSFTAGPCVAILPPIFVDGTVNTCDGSEEIPDGSLTANQTRACAAVMGCPPLDIPD